MLRQLLASSWFWVGHYARMSIPILIALLVFACAVRYAHSSPLPPILTDRPAVVCVGGNLTYVWTVGLDRLWNWHFVPHRDWTFFNFYTGHQSVLIDVQCRGQGIRR